MQGIDALLISLDSIPDEDLRRIGLDLYVRELVNCTIVDRDGKRIFFDERRFDHAFYDSNYDRETNERWRQHFPSRRRIERIQWIAPIVGGLVEGAECWDLPASDRPHLRKRAYICRGDPYIIWLEPKTGDAWRFSSAYPCDAKQLRKAVIGAHRIWPELRIKEATL